MNEWVLLDTETNGIRDPIFVLEVAAQRFDGINPIGEPVRYFLNHGVRIDPDATRVHGYTEAYIRKVGISPLVAYQGLRDYIGDRQVAAHNVSFDWNRVLEPEYRRLGISPIGRRGMCTMKLSRRSLHDESSHGMDHLRERFSLRCERAHSALGDVQSLTELLTKVIFPVLSRAGLQDFQSIAEFSEICPVPKAHALIKGETFIKKAYVKKVNTLRAIPQPVPISAPIIMSIPNLEEQPYQLIALEQGTQAWKDWRNEGIGASDAPTILGENPWKDASELLCSKRTGADVEANFAMRRGTELEATARALYIERVGKEFRPACLQSKRLPWLRASVDGLAVDGSAVLEIKCGDSVYRKTALSKRPPAYYYGQLQHILAVTGLPSIDFFCYLPGCRELLVTVERDTAYIGHMLEVEHAFYEQMCRRI